MMVQTENNTNIELPSVLAFERKLETSDGLMYAGSWEYCGKEHIDNEPKNDKDKPEPAWTAIPIDHRQNRSTQSAFGIDDIKKTMPNPVSSDSDDANLPMDKDTLKVTFSLRVIGQVGNPFACNAPDFATAIKNKLNEFKESKSMEQLAFRYAYNIANGRFLWRNRVGAEDIKIHVSLTDGTALPALNAYDFSLNNFEQNSDNETLQEIVTEIKKGLASGDENNFVLLKVNAYVKLGKGQHVFPSQEMNMGEKKKKLFQLDGCAAMHNVKIGNAIRTIDTWYGDTMMIKTKNSKGKDAVATVDIGTSNKQPIAIEPYGSVTQHGRAYRPNTNDLYTLMLDWVRDNEITDSDKMYVVANLIRGGVFGGDSES